MVLLVLVSSHYGTITFLFSTLCFFFVNLIVDIKSVVHTKNTYIRSKNFRIRYSDLFFTGIKDDTYMLPGTVPYGINVTSTRVKINYRYVRYRIRKIDWISHHTFRIIRTY